MSEAPSGGGSGILFAVRDTGIGIPPDRLHRLFRSFSQVDSSTTRHYGGTGLGLAISKGLVELMRGKIWVESTEGKGSTFAFVLPLQVAAETPKGVLKKRPIQFAGLRLLIVEDNTAARKALVKLTQSWGLAAVDAGSGEEAIERLRKGEHFDLALLDLHLPGEADGGRLVEELRRFPQTRSLPIVLMTSVGARSATVDLKTGAATDILTKPIKPSQLQSILLSLITGVKRTEKKTAPAAKLSSTLAQRLPLRVLLADDNVINQKVALRLRQQIGYRADTANNGLESLQALEQRPYYIVFTYVQMPEMDGLEASRQIRQRQQEPSPHPHFKQALTIIAMTANAMQGDREKCLAAGMNDYISKPVRPEVLQGIIEKVGAPAVAAPAIGSETAEPAIISNLSPTLEKTATCSVAPTGLSAPSVDLERLLEFAGGSMENFEELVDLYLNQTRNQLSEIAEAISRGNSVSASKVAHSCAGASATCGMVAIVPILRELEHHGKAGDLARLPDLLRSAQLEFDRIQEFFANRAKSLSPLETSSSAL